MCVYVSVLMCVCVSLYHVDVLLVPGPQAAQDRTRHRRRPVGQPLPDGRRVDVIQAAGVDDDLHPLERRGTPGESTSVSSQVQSIQDSFWILSDFSFWLIHYDP